MDYFKDSLTSILDAAVSFPSEVLIINTLEEDIDLSEFDDLTKVKVFRRLGASYEESILLGISLSTATYVALMNDDDTCALDRFTTQISSLEQNGSDLVIGKMKKFGSNRISINWDPNYDDYHSSMLLLGPYGANATLLANRAWISSRVNKEKFVVWDWEFALTNYPESKISGVNVVLYNYRQHHKQVTRTIAHKQELNQSIPARWMICPLNKPNLQISDRAIRTILFPHQNSLKHICFKLFTKESFLIRKEVTTWLVWFWRSHVVRQYGLRNKIWFMYHAVIRFMVI
jgi:hypothetical protein